MAPGYEQLESMPGILKALTWDISEDEARWKPSPHRWSILEVLGHLVHVEAHGFRNRAARILAEDNPRLDNYDPDALLVAGAYRQRSVLLALDIFGAQREQSLELLRSISTESWSRPAVHSALGSMTLGDLLHEWPLHDLGHLRQIAELIRAVKYYPHIGPWQKFYTLHP